MKVILLLTVFGIICITVGLLGLYASVIQRLSKLERDHKESNKTIKRNKKRIEVLEARDQATSDRVVITHEWKEADGIRYPSQEV